MQQWPVPSAAAPFAASSAGADSAVGELGRNLVAANFSRPSVLVQKAHDEVQRWRTETKELEARLEASEQHRVIAEESSEALRGRWEVALQVMEQEMKLMASVRDEAEQRAQRSDDRLTGLLSESRETAVYMSELASRCEEQTNLNNSLVSKLQQSEAYCDKLKSELAEALVRQVDLTKNLDKTEAVVATVVPRLTDEAREQGRIAQQAMDTRQRLRYAESTFNSQARDLQEQLAMEREEKHALGRKCAEHYKLAAMHANAGHQWQQRSRAAEEELMRHGISHAALWQVARQQRAEQWMREEQLRELEAERDRALAAKERAEGATRDMTGWVVSSLSEVNRTAHARQDAHTPSTGQAWVSMLEDFKRNGQARSGPGNRTRPAM